MLAGPFGNLPLKARLFSIQQERAVLNSGEKGISSLQVIDIFLGLN